jgi:NAD dependent epimerase/dehydratase family enzyme
VGIYGSRGDEVLDEDAAPAEGFLADVCRDWEAEAARAEALGVRVVPKRALDAGFVFEHPTLAPALTATFARAMFVTRTVERIFDFRAHAIAEHFGATTVAA